MPHVVVELDDETYVLIAVKARDAGIAPQEMVSAVTKVYARMLREGAEKVDLNSALEAALKLVDEIG